MTDLPDNDPRRINQVLDDTVGNSCTLLGAQHIDVNNPYSVNDSHSAISWTTLDIPDSVSDVNVTVVASLRIYDSIASQAKVNFEFTTDRKKTRENTAVFDNNNDVVMAVEKAFGLANSMISNIEAGVLEIDGMSGNKFRHFLNNLVRLVGCENYLEIGVWAGSSFCSAINNNFNLVHALAIDNFSEYGGPKDVFLNNVNKFKTNKDLKSFLYESDCWKVDRNAVASNGPFQVYFFDGPHEQQDHYRAMIDYFEFLDDYNVVILVDD
ncbi:hypothetical protein ScalyP_jg11465 [Parmales sp. scaly parma]|nr:hypothetical protein ScalyP_jg11465 [Parmales sp. scaly parma]